MAQAIFIPADFDQPVARVDIENREQLAQLLGGTPERAVYDRDV